MRYILVKAHPGSSRNSVLRKSEDRFEVFTKEPKEQNRANLHIEDLLAEFLGVPKDSLRLVRGHHQQNKTFIIQNGSKN